MYTARSTLISATVLLAIACSSGEKKEPEAKPSVEQPVAQAPEPDANADAKAPEQDAKTTEADAKAPEADVKTPEADTKPPEPQPVAEPGSVPVTVITPITATTAWREVATIDGSLQFANLSGGVVGTTAAGYWDVSDAGELVLRSEIEAPAATMLGVWPSDVWYVETRVKEEGDDRAEARIEELRLMKLRSNHRWVPQEYGGEQRFVDEGHRIKKGWKGGLLVSDGSERSYTRVAGGSGDVELTTQNGEVIDFFESKSGRLYVITEADGAFWAQQDCGLEQCEPAPALKLPAGTAWDFPLQVGRQRHSISALAFATVEGGKQHYVLHYETGGWKLEQLAVQPVGLWPTKGGGLWTQAGSALWHRDPDGNWRNVALPEGAGAVTVAISTDQTQLWIAAVVGDKSVVYATHAEAQELPPAGTVEPQSG